MDNTNMEFMVIDGYKKRKQKKIEERNILQKSLDTLNRDINDNEILINDMLHRKELEKQHKYEYMMKLTDPYIMKTISKKIMGNASYIDISYAEIDNYHDDMNINCKSSCKGWDGFSKTCECNTKILSWMIGHLDTRINVDGFLK